MKKYVVRHYKGNLIESLGNFSKKFPNFKVVRIVEENESLKIEADQVLKKKGNISAKDIEEQDYQKILDGKIREILSKSGKSNVDCRVFTSKEIINDKSELLKHAKDNAKIKIKELIGKNKFVVILTTNERDKADADIFLKKFRSELSKILNFENLKPIILKGKFSESGNDTYALMFPGNISLAFNYEG